MKMTRRIFIINVLSTAAVSCLSSSLITPSHAKTTAAVREFRLSASRTRVNLGAGPDFWAWTNNGQLPGPEIRVKEGEIIRVVLKNLLPEETSIHWHGVPVPNPMERLEIEFIEDNPGKWFHHCHNLYHMMAGMGNVMTVG